MTEQNILHFSATLHMLGCYAGHGGGIQAAYRNVAGIEESAVGDRLRSVGCMPHQLMPETELRAMCAGFCCILANLFLLGK